MCATVQIGSLVARLVSMRGTYALQMRAIAIGAAANTPNNIIVTMVWVSCTAEIRAAHNGHSDASAFPFACLQDLS